jgi:hypothetical protein
VIRSRSAASSAPSSSSSSASWRLPTSRVARAGSSVRRVVPGACSSAMWVLMPPKPMADTPARIGRSAGHSSASLGTYSAAASSVSFGCGS